MTGLAQGYVEYAGDLIKQPKARVVPQFHIALPRCRLSAPSLRRVMHIKLFSGPGRCFALTPTPLPTGEGLLSCPLPPGERVALSLSKGRVRGRTDRLGAGDTTRITRSEGEGMSTPSPLEACPEPVEGERAGVRGKMQHPKPTSARSWGRTPCVSTALRPERRRSQSRSTQSSRTGGTRRWAGTRSTPIRRSSSACQ